MFVCECVRYLIEFDVCACVGVSGYAFVCLCVVRCVRG